MKKLIAFLLVLGLLLLVVGCGSSDNSSSASSPTTSNKPNQPTPPENNTANEVPNGEALSAIPSSFPQKFVLTTKLNIWKTELALKKDGSFSGKYIETVEESSEELGYPNGKFLICEFSGKFDNFLKIDDHTYAMKLSVLSPNYGPEEFWIENGILYETAHPVGIDGGEWFYIYLPGKNTEGLDEAFRMWYTDGEKIPEVLDRYGLYNPKSRYAFFG